MEIKRRPFQGVLNILSFNRHFYVVGIIVWAVLFATMHYAVIGMLWKVIVNFLFVYGLVMPLLVSAYVYDYAGYYELKWLKKMQLNSSYNTMMLVNINAGFDETSFLLKKSLPNSELKVFDFYHAKQHTEPAIVRARKVSLSYPNTKQINSEFIPMEDQSADTIFLLSAAHEIRAYDEKVLFLRECHRICKAHGQVIMVEHLRDLPNFLAFSVGFTHFFSRKTWTKAFNEAGFTSFQETKFTPFMSIFNYQP